MRSHAIALAARDGTPTDAQLGLIRFLSRHGALLGAGPQHVVRDRVGQLVDYVLATDRWPTRSSDPAVVLQAVARWHRAMAQATHARALRPLVAFPCCNGGADDVALPPPPFWWEGVPGVSLDPVRSARQLVDEGRTMRHCVAGRLHELLEGRAHIFTGTACGQRVTVEVLPNADGSWALGEHRSVANRSVQPAAVAAIRAWVSGLRARGVPSPS